MSPKIQVKLLLLVQERLGRTELVIESDTIRELQLKIIEAHSDQMLKDNMFVSKETGLFHEWMLVLVNGRNTKFLDGLDTILKDGDVVVICPPVGGGY